MVLNNATPRLLDFMKLADETKQPQEAFFIYDEMLTNDTIGAVFMWIFKRGYDFTTRHDEYRFVVIIHPKKA